MKDITDITVAQIRLYPPDKIPFQQLGAGRKADAIKEAFCFESVQSEAARGLTFVNGAFPQLGIVINELSIDARRTLLRVLGSSSQADVIYTALWEQLRSLVPKERPFDEKPLIKSQETSCVVTLEIGIDDLVAPPLVKLISEDGKRLLSTKSARVKAIDVNRVAFTVRYAPDDPQLEERGVQIVNKTITFQARAGTVKGENRFFVSSPTDSDKHFELLEGIESVLKTRKGLKET
jgi:hypothetical protein